MRITVLIIAVLTSALASNVVRAKPAPVEGLSENDVVEMLPGVVEPAEHVSMSAPFDGVLMQMNVSEGQEVEAGKTLATMDNRVAAAAVRLAQQRADDQTTLHLVQSELESAARFAERVAAAHQNEAASDVELDNAQFALEQAKRRLSRVRNQISQALANLELEQARYEEHFVRAPFAGRVLRIEARKGQALNRADKVLTLANLDRLTVELQVPLKFFRRLNVGQQCWLAADVPVEARLPAVVVNVEPTVDPATRTFRCRLEIDNRSLNLPSGFTVKLIAPNPPPIVATNRN